MSPTLLAHHLEQMQAHRQAFWAEWTKINPPKSPNAKPDYRAQDEAWKAYYKLHCPVAPK